MAKRNIVVDVKKDNGADQQRESPSGSSLVSWVMTRVTDWEDHRKQNFDAKWDEYYRLWRGIWAKEDASRDSERSKIITPALSQAIESTVAELEEATFGSGKWFDVSDDFEDKDSADIQMWRDQLAEDFTKEDVEGAISEIFLNGAICGTGIGKIILNEVQDKRIVPKVVGDTEITTIDTETVNTVRVGLMAVHPKEFVIDPTARNIDDALGMAHITNVPKHTIQRLQASGVYQDVVISSFNDTLVGGDTERDKEELEAIDDDGKTMLIEYHGFVPSKLLKEVGDSYEDKSYDEAEDIEITDGDDLVEAIVTIANSSTLLRAVENPYSMGDRCFIAYQHDKVPNRFWGRGIGEKGYNPQKALDAEARGRIDAMALSIHPMMAMDATRLHRGASFKIAPGKTVLTNGDPRGIMMPFNFGQVNPSTFNQSADLERQVQMGTGAMDTATSAQGHAGNATAGGMSMIQGGSIKRNKRTLANIERKFTRPLIHKAAWRYMQFAPERYPVQDIKFNVHSTLGIVARELEQSQLANMMKTVPADSPAFWMLLKGIFEHSNSSNREEMIVVIKQMMEKSIQDKSQPPPEDPMIALKREEMMLDSQIEAAKLKMKQEEGSQAMQLDVAKLQLKREELALKREGMMLDAKVSLAQMEQDSEVTAAQMAESRQRMERS
tara:strand:+ start:2028 stop:4028 length:2001 start_codon:yes stop_codon:yes gene_type:complete